MGGQRPAGIDPEPNYVVGYDPPVEYITIDRVLDYKSERDERLKKFNAERKVSQEESDKKSKEDIEAEQKEIEWIKEIIKIAKQK